MAQRKVFGRVELNHDGHDYIVELTKKGMVLHEKRKHNKVAVGIRSLVKLLEPQMEFFAISKPKEKTTEGERAISELKEVHAELSLMTGAATDGVNWRSLLQIIYTKLKGQNETEIRTNTVSPDPTTTEGSSPQVSTDGHEGG